MPEIDQGRFRPEGDPPAIRPSAAHLIREPCPECGKSRLFTQTLHQRRDPHVGLPLYRLEVLCGDCMTVFVRSDPDDYWLRIQKATDKWCAVCADDTRVKTGRRIDGKVAVVTMTCARCGDVEDRRVE